ncbi:hypothetical protein [Nocardia sp. NPDC006630]|uniref:hypothetical protein n=1 Tax=Nocardia sp. NPDC006630 TaxID=3157181 RepID=UPI0033A71C6E
METDLKKLAGLQDDFGNALKSPAAGMAVQNAMGNAWQSGKSLGSTLQDVITVLKQHGTNVHAQDLEGQSRVNAAIGGDGHLDVGQWNPTPKVDTNSWA